MLRLTLRERGQGDPSRCFYMFAPGTIDQDGLHDFTTSSPGVSCPSTTLTQPPGFAVLCGLEAAIQRGLPAFEVLFWRSRPSFNLAGAAFSGLPGLPIDEQESFGGLVFVARAIAPYKPSHTPYGSTPRAARLFGRHLVFRP